LAEGVATTPCCCAKLVFMLLTIGLWRRAGLLKLWVAASNGPAKCNFGISKPIGFDKPDRTNFAKFTRKLKVGLQ